MNPWRLSQHWNPCKIIFGPNSLNQLPQELSREDVCFIVTDKGVANAGIVNKVINILEKSNIRYYIFDKTASDPTIEIVEEGIAAYQNQGCSTLIGLGGGSPIDTAKAVGIGVTHTGNVRKYFGRRPLEFNLPPLIAIPTTAGTGSEVSASAIVTDKGCKNVLRSHQLFPKVSVLDPLLLSSIPSRVAVETGADAFTHALESYVSLSSQLISECLSISAIRLISHYLPRFVANPEDLEAASHMQLASSLAGMAFTSGGLGLAHALANCIGAQYHLGHGLLCGLFLPAVMDFNVIACPEKFAAIAQAMGVDVIRISNDMAAQKAVNAVKNLFSGIGLPKTFAELGIEFRLDSEMVDEIFSTIPCKENPRRADKEQIVKILERLNYSPVNCGSMVGLPKVVTKNLL
jgi:alcohol dehydrogenase class IV